MPCMSRAAAAPATRGQLRVRSRLRCVSAKARLPAGPASPPTVQVGPLPPARAAQRCVRKPPSLREASQKRELSSQRRSGVGVGWPPPVAAGNLTGLNEQMLAHRTLLPLQASTTMARCHRLFPLLAGVLLLLAPGRSAAQAETVPLAINTARVCVRGWGGWGRRGVQGKRVAAAKRGFEVAGEILGAGIPSPLSDRIPPLPTAGSPRWRSSLRLRVRPRRAQASRPPS